MRYESKVWSGARRCRRLLMPLVLAPAAAAVPACQSSIDPNVPEPIRRVRQPDGERDYLLYRPSNYDRSLEWPLVVVCHGGWGDSPEKRIRDWTQLAQTKGFLAAAPRLTSPPGLFERDEAKQRERQQDDERRILSVVQHVRAGHNISMDRIFLYGFSGGAVPALYTGLRHCDLFRAVALTQPRFDSSYVFEWKGSACGHLPVYVHHGVTDALTGGQARDCIDWLRALGVSLEEESTGPAGPDNIRGCVTFFEDVVRSLPWLRIHASTSDSGSPRALRFRVESSFEPQTYLWTFGDGEISPAAEPLHVYTRSGGYEVSVQVTDEKGRRLERSKRVIVH